MGRWDKLNPDALTERELEILAKVAAGKSNVEIANELQLSISTVKFHLKNVFAKLRVKNRTRAALKYRVEQTKKERGEESMIR